MLLYLGNMSTRPILFWFIYSTGYILRHAITNLQVSSRTLLPQPSNKSCCVFRIGGLVSGRRNTKLQLQRR